MENLLFSLSNLSKLLGPFAEKFCAALRAVNKVMFFDYETVERKRCEWIQLLGNCRSRGEEEGKLGDRENGVRVIIKA